MSRVSGLDSKAIAPSMRTSKRHGRPIRMRGMLNPRVHLQFSTPVAINTFSFLWDPQAKPHKFRVGFREQVGDDDSWIWSREYVSANHRQRLSWAVPVECDAFRIWTSELESGSDRVQLYELELYGPKDETLPSFRMGSNAGQSADSWARACHPLAPIARPGLASWALARG